MGEITICVECKFLHKLGVEWHEHFCKAISLREETDCVTGKKGYRHVNSLGDTSFIDSPYPYCRDVNHGKCSHYKPIKATD